MAGIVKPTTKRVEAQVQKLFEIAVRKPPIINVAKHVKKDNLRPILSNKINRCCLLTSLTYIKQKMFVNSTRQNKFL